MLHPDHCARFLENSDRLAQARNLYLARVVEAMRLPLDKMKSEGKLRLSDPALFLLTLLVPFLTFLSLYPL